MIDFISKRIETLSFSKYKLLLNPYNSSNIITSERLEFQLNELNLELKYLSDVFLKLSGAIKYTYGNTLNLDDMMIYFNSEALQLESSSIYEKFYTQVKWLSVTDKYLVWKKYAETLKFLKEESISRMKLLTSDPTIGKVRLKVKIVTNINAKNLARQREMMKKVHAQHSTFAEEHLNLNEELLGSHFSDIDLPPVLISSATQLTTQLESIAKEFNLITITIQKENSGYTITNQINYLLPQLFEIQAQKLEWVAYGDVQGKEKARKKLISLPQRNISKLKTLRKHSSVNETEDSNKIICKIICIKDSQWAQNIIIKVNSMPWEKKQEARLHNIGKNDTLLENSFASLNIQSLSAVVKLLEEFSMTYAEKSTKRGALRSELADNTDDLKKRYFANLLKDKTSSQISEFEPVILNSNNIKSFYTLKLLKSRELKFKLLGILNVFRSVERRLNMDIQDIPHILKADFKKVSLENRTDSIEIIEGEYYIKDSKEEWIIYKVVFEDFEDTIKWLVQIGSFFIEKHEVLLNHNTSQYPPIDREILMSELIEEEAKFQESKLGLVISLMKVYENLINVDSMLDLATYIIRIIKMKPRLNLSNSYFTQSYWAHTQSITVQNYVIESIYNYHAAQKNDFRFPLSRIIESIKAIETTLEDLSLQFEISCVKEVSALEAVIWDTALAKWSDILLKGKTEDVVQWRHCTQAFRDLNVEILNENIRELDKSLFTQDQFFANIVNFMNFARKIFTNNTEALILLQVFNRQLRFSDGNEGISGRSSRRRANDYYFNYSIFEVAKDSFQCLNFYDMDNIKNGLYGLGMQKMLTAVKYEIFNKQVIEVVVRINSMCMDRWLKQIAEIELASDKNYITKHSKINWMTVLGRKGEGIIQQRVEAEIKKLVNDMNSNIEFLDLGAIKNGQKSSLLSEIQIPENSRNGEDAFGYENLKNQKIIEYCQSVLEHVRSLCINIQVFKVIQELNMIIKIVPDKPLSDLFTAYREKNINNPNQINLYQLPVLEKKLMNNKLGLNPQEKTKILHELAGLLHYTKMLIFLNLLKSSSKNVLDLYDIPSLEIQPSDEENAMESLVQIFMNNDEMKVVVETLTSICTYKTSDWEKVSRNCYQALMISLYALLDKTLRDGNKPECEHVKEMISSLFRYSGTSLKNPEPVSESVITICQKFFLKEECENLAGIRGGYLSELNWGLINLSTENRVFTWNAATKLFHRNAEKSLHMRDENIEGAENELRLHKLKVMFLECKASQSNYSLSYSDCLSLLNDYTCTVEYDSTIGNDIGQIQILRDYFASELCSYGIAQITSRLKYESMPSFQGLHDFSCNFDGSYKDPTNKIGCMHSFFNSFRNHCSRVETPTAGYALVAYIKDITYFTRIFSENFMHFNEQQFCAKGDIAKLQMSFLQSQIDLKDKEVSRFKDSSEKMKKSFDHIVNANVTQKGSEIIYNLDTAHRQLREIKENTKLLEKYTRILVNNEFKERIETKDREIRDLELNYKSFQQELAQNIHSQLETNVTEGINMVMPYSSKIKRKRIERILSETKASTKSRSIAEKKRLGNYIVLLRVFNQWSVEKNRLKIDKEVALLKSQLKSNQYIWEELNHTQRRETILKQDLAHAQSTLSNSEKLVEKLQQDIEEINIQKLQLELYRENKGKHMQQLEDMLKNKKSLKSSQQIVAEYLQKKDKIKELQHTELQTGQEYVDSHNSYQLQIKTLKGTLETIRSQKNEAITNLNMIRAELESRSQETNWKDKVFKLERTLTQSTSKNFNEYSSRSPSENRSANFFPKIKPN